MNRTRKMISLILVVMLLMTMIVPANAEDWICISCGSSVAGNFCNNCGSAKPVVESEDWTCPGCATLATGKFCSSCGTARPQAGTAVGVLNPDVQHAVAEATAHMPVTISSSPDKYTWYIRDYVGSNLASVGYTSLGGERRDQYGAGNLKLTLVTVDSTWVDVEDEMLLRKYVVIGQSPAANTELKYTFEKDSKGNEYSNLIDSKSYEEIDLLIAPINGVVYNDLIDMNLVQIDPAPDKYTCHIRNYVGKNLAAIGYTSLGGERRDSYSDTNIKLSLSTPDGTFIDVEDSDQLAQYVVIRQDVSPNSVMRLVYSKDSKGNEYSNLVESKSYDQVTLYLRKIVVLPKAETSAAKQEPSAATATVSSVPSATAGTTFSAKGFTCEVLPDDTVRIIGYTGHSASVSVSSSLNDHEVSAIGDSVFEGHSEIDTIIMWAKPTEIGARCFKGCTSLTDISIPSSVLTIGEAAFEGCTSLETVIMWAKPEEIKANTFKGCTSLTDISISSNTKVIGKSAFEGCTSMETVIMWGGTNIEEAAFRDCTALTDISINSKTEYIGDYAFYGCTSLESVILWSKKTKIGAEAFGNCPNLTDMTKW